MGTDPGTSSLDLLLLVDGEVADQRRLLPDDLRRNPEALSAILAAWAPIDLIAGPSGYGLPLIRGKDVGREELDLLSLVKPEDRGQEVGVIGFRARVRAFLASGFPLVFLPGLIHLPTVPSHRKFNTIDLGTPDKLAVAALALRCDGDAHGDFRRSTFAVVEIGSAFSAILVVLEGRLVDASAGTRGPIGLQSGGCWDGEVAYMRAPLSKRGLFRGGLIDLGAEGLDAFRESLIKQIAGLRAVTPFETIYLSGAGLERPEVDAAAGASLSTFGQVVRLPMLPRAWVKHAAQGSALLADGLAGGRNADLVASLRLNESRGTALDWLRPPLGSSS